MWVYSVKTPVFEFKNYVFFNDIGNIFVVSQKDYFDQSVATQLQKIIVREKFDFSSGVLVLRGVDIDDYCFDQIVLLPAADYHDTFRSDIPDVHSRTVVVFPCHHSEVIGNEDVKELKHIRSKLVSTSNLKRDISPRIKFWFENFTIKTKTPSKKPTLASLDFVTKILAQLINDGGNAELINYRGEGIDVRFDDNQFDVTVAGKNQHGNSVTSLMKIIRKFLIE